VVGVKCGVWRLKVSEKLAERLEEDLMEIDVLWSDGNDVEWI
jgi:hypothetical protein